MKNVIKFFSLVALAIAIMILNHFGYVTPTGAEIMIVSLVFFAGWYFGTQLGKEKDA